MRLGNSDIPRHIPLRLQRVVAHIRWASVGRSDSNTNLVPRKTRSMGFPAAHISESSGSSIPPSVPFLRLRRHNERDSLRKFSHCPPRNSSRQPSCPPTPTLDYSRLSNVKLALVMARARWVSVLLMGSEQLVRLGYPIATFRSCVEHSTISVERLPIEGACQH